MKLDKQQLAKDLYLQTDKTQQEIADILSVDRKSVYLWMKSGKWEEIKIAARQTPSVILHNLYNHIEEVEKKIRKRDPDDRCPTMQEIEMLRKLIAMTKSVGGVGVGGHIDVYEELIRHARKKDVGFSIEIRKIADEVLEGTLINKDFIRREEMQDFDERMKKVEEERAAFAQAHSTEPDAEVPVPIISGSPAEVASPAEVVSPAELTSSVENSTDNSPFSERPVSEAKQNVPANDGRGQGGCPDNIGPELPMGKNGEFSGRSDTPELTSDITPKPATTQHHEENNNETAEEKFPTKNYSGNGEFVAIDPPKKLSLPDATHNNPNSELPTTNSIDNDPNTELPNPNSNQIDFSQRVSPFRDGNILWVNYIDDVDNKYDSLGQLWGERKIGDTIRYYPGMDPYERKNNAA